MAVAENGPGRRDWKKRESFLSALLQVGIVGVLLAGAVFFIYQRNMKKKEAAERTVAAKGFAVKDNPADLKKALDELDALFVLNPEAADGLALAADIHTELWLTHRLMDSQAKAKDFLAKAEAAGSKSEDRYGAKALQILAEGRATEAETFVDELRKSGASSAKLWYGQARASQATGNLALSRQAFGQAMDKAWKNPRFSSAFGEALIEEGQFSQAIETFGKAVSANPDHLRGRLGVALAQLYKRDRTGDAQATVSEVLARDAELTPGLKARALAAKAEVANVQEKYDEAIVAADEALSVNTEEYFALFAKGRALAGKKDPAAHEVFKTTVGKRPTSPYFYFEAASLLVKAGNADGAIGVLDSYERQFKDIKLQTTDGNAISVLERDDKYWIARGDVQKELGKLDEAMASYDKAIAAESVNGAKARNARGGLFLLKKDYDKALEALIDIAPPDGTGMIADAYVTTGNAQFAKKDYPAACQSFAFALTRMKAQQAPRENLNALLEDVNKRLIAEKQGAIAKLWMEEAKPIIQ